MRSLREIREARGMTLADVAARSGLGIQTIRYAEMTEVRPRIDTVIAISKALDVSLEQAVA